MVVKLLIVILLIGGSGFVVIQMNNKSASIQYQTGEVSRGPLIISVTGTGQVAATNSVQVTTKASGVLKAVYVKDGDAVKAGDKIAEVELDIEGKQRAAASLASYKSAQNSVENARISFYTLQTDMLTKWKDYMDLAQNTTYQNADSSPRTDNRQQVAFVTTNNDWLEAEAKYKNQKNQLTQAETSLNSAWLSYQQTSPTIVAPISGVVSGLSLIPGAVITSQSDSGSAASQKIANVKTGISPLVSVNLTQIDIPKVHVGDKAMITFDAFSDKTYTGKVVSIDSVGSVSSGVATYPTFIQLDVQNQAILPNMSASASIITMTKKDVLLVPSSAVTTTNEQSSVKVMRDGKPVEVVVEVGISSDSETEIISGISEGEIVVTGEISSAGGSRSNTVTSPFSAFGSRSGGFGGGAVRIGR